MQNITSSTEGSTPPLYSSSNTWSEGALALMLITGTPTPSISSKSVKDIPVLVVGTTNSGTGSTITGAVYSVNTNVLMVFVSIKFLTSFLDFLFEVVVWVGVSSTPDVGSVSFFGFTSPNARIQFSINPFNPTSDSSYSLYLHTK